jgi:hypothetical protein
VVEVRGVVGVSPALWYFRFSEHIFDSTKAPVVSDRTCYDFADAGSQQRIINYRTCKTGI